MMTQIVGMQQIVITVVFLSCLIGLLIFLRMKGGSIRANLQKGQRIRVVVETAVSPAERLRLINIDGCEFLMLSGKGIQPSLLQLSTSVTPPHTPVPSESSFAAAAQLPLELMSPVSPQVGEQVANATQPYDIPPYQVDHTQKDSTEMDPNEVAAFAAKFKGWRKK